jgi:uracil phosphoribosyltransferase
MGMTIHHLSESNSILNQFLAEIRDTQIHNDRLRFRHNIERIGAIMAYEISRSLHYVATTVRTPLGSLDIPLPADNLVLATILRAGLPFHHGFLDIFDRAESAFISAARRYSADHSQFEIVTEYLSAPPIEGKTLILADPMLATCSSLDRAYQALRRQGEPAAVHVACVIASRQGIEAAGALLPAGKTTIWAAAIDPGLNESAYIVPGLGDAGDLAYGEKL